MDKLSIIVAMTRSRWQEIRRLAQQEGAKRDTIAKWRQRGIPDRWRIQLSQAARAEGLSSLAEELLSTTIRSKARSPGQRVTGDSA